MKKYYFLFFVVILGAVLLVLLSATSLNEVAFKAASDGPDNKVQKKSDLQVKSDALLGLFDDMPSVAVSVVDEPILPGGSNTERGVAYTRCAKDALPQIFIKKHFYERSNEKQLTNILKHELTHVWLCRQNLMNGHDENFRKKFAAVGGFGN